MEVKMDIRVIRVKQYKKGITLYKNNALGLCKTYDGFNIEDIKEIINKYPEYELRFKFD